jgi:hypothetical protein
MGLLDEIIGKFRGAQKAMKYIAMFRAVHWRRASESPDYATCAVADLSINVDPGIIKWFAIVVKCLKAIDPAVDTEHPVFKYMSDQFKKDHTAELEVTISIKKRGT